jgi:hypothetical protein
MYTHHRAIDGELGGEHGGAVGFLGPIVRWRKRVYCTAKEEC